MPRKPTPPALIGGLPPDMLSSLLDEHGRNDGFLDRILIGGPYQVPACEVGTSLTCRRFGRQAVGGFTAAPIPWPYAARQGGKPPLILCGDLVKAIRTETAAAVAYHWGVSRWTVHHWRRVLGVGRFTAGTRRRWQELAAKKFTPDVNRKAQAASVIARRRNSAGGEPPC